MRKYVETLVNDVSDYTDLVEDTTTLMYIIYTNPYSDSIYNIFSFNIIVQSHPSARVYFAKPPYYASDLNKGVQVTKLINNPIVINTTVVHNVRSTESFNQSNNAENAIPITYIVLGSQFTVKLWWNTHLLTNICHSDYTMCIQCSSVVVFFTLVISLKVSVTGCYHTEGIYNIIVLTKTKG